jgi:hypothetical protein
LCAFAGFGRESILFNFQTIDVRSQRHLKDRLTRKNLPVQSSIHGGKPKGMLATILYRVAIKIRGLASLSPLRRREGRTSRCLSRRSVRPS